MEFKNVAYRLGYGKNIVGESDYGVTKIYYKTKDNLVRTKKFWQKGAGFALSGADEVFNATSVLPFKDGYILARQNNEIKAKPTAAAEQK